MSVTLSQSCTGASNYPPSAAGGSGGTAGTFWTSNVPAGDVVVCAVIIPGTGNPGTITVADDLSNAYTALNHYYDSTNTAWVGIFYIVQPTTRSPTVTATLGTSQYGNIVLADFTGFVGAVTADASANNSARGSSTSVSVTPVDNIYAGELVLCTAYLNYGWNSPPASWTGIGSQSTLYYAVISGASGNTPFTGTLGSSAAWDGVTGGLYGKASSYSLALASATYTISGQNATLNEQGGQNPYILCFPGTYNMLGAPASSDFVQYAAKGSYTYTGFPTGTVSYSLALAAGSYALTGHTVTFPPIGITFPLSAGSYSITGFTATLTEAAQPAGLMMPYLVGLLYEEAQYVLAHSEILTITPPYQNYFTTPFPITLVWVKSSQPPSTVLAQSIPAGITVAINQPMTLTLSQYPIAISITDP